MTKTPVKPAWDSSTADHMAEEQQQNVFGRIANKVDSVFQSRYYKIGLFVGTRPGISIGATFLFVALCAAGFSQLKSESRPDKLWIPQNTRAQQDEAAYVAHFPPDMRVNSMLLEAKSGSALTHGFLEAAATLHAEIEGIQSEGDNLTSLCVAMPADGHPCFITSVLGAWNYDAAAIQADANPIATLNSQGWSRDDMERLLGDAEFDANGALTTARALRMAYFLRSHRERSGGGYEDPRGSGWEELLLQHLGCEDPTCDGGACVCAYASDQFTVYPLATRSFGDAFGSVIRGDVSLINGAFMIMILYLIVNLGGLGHKIQSRSLLAFGSVISIVVAGAAGYGLSMWMQFPYTPVHSVLPFVILGIGVDDSFVIMNAFDRTDASLPVAERIAQAISHAGVSIMVTSITDFVALAISVSSALPALSAFCMYAALAVLFLFFMQISLFTALATWDAHRVKKGRIDCCFCLPRGCPCCHTVPVEDAAATVEGGGRDPNQMCCTPPEHKGGLVGKFLEKMYGPVIVKPAVAVAIAFIFLAFCGICSWQASELNVEDTQRNFIPDNSYVSQTLDKNNEYFARLGYSVYLMTGSGDYFASQAALAAVGGRLGALSFVQPTAGEAFMSWAQGFKEACAAGTVTPPVTLDSDGHVSVRSEYYASLSAWLRGAGRRYSSEVIWADEADPQAGITASRISFAIEGMPTQIGGRTAIDAGLAVDVMDQLRTAVDSWQDIPGGAIVYSRDFLTWETFRIIKKEMFLSVGLCLVAVLIIMLLLIAHPLTAGLVFLCVLMTIVDILGCLNMMGVAIDNVSVIQLVIAVGFCVDYAAHIGHNFMLQSGTLQERVVATLGNVGSAVLNGGISTLLATMLLALSKSYVFRVLFYSFALTVSLGLLHGMVLLPALLSLVGPRGYGSSQAHAQNKVAAEEIDDGKLGS